MDRKIKISKAIQEALNKDIKRELRNEERNKLHNKTAKIIMIDDEFWFIDMEKEF